MQHTIMEVKRRVRVFFGRNVYIHTCICGNIYICIIYTHHQGGQTTGACFPGQEHIYIYMYILWEHIYMNNVHMQHSPQVSCIRLCCSLLQCVAVCCSVMQCVAVCCRSLFLQFISCVGLFSHCVVECCRVLQSVAVCCSVLQCVAVCCSVLQVSFPSIHLVCRSLLKYDSFDLSAHFF